MGDQNGGNERKKKRWIMKKLIQIPIFLIQCLIALLAYIAVTIFYNPK